MFKFKLSKIIDIKPENGYLAYCLINGHYSILFFDKKMLDMFNTDIFFIAYNQAIYITENGPVIKNSSVNWRDEIFKGSQIKFQNFLQEKKMTFESVVNKMVWYNNMALLNTTFNGEKLFKINLWYDTINLHKLLYREDSFILNIA